MRKGHVLSVVLHRHVVRFAVRGLGQQQAPALSRESLWDAAGVHAPDPVRQRVRVVAARRELAIRGRIPEHALLGATERQNRAAVLARDRQRARVRVPRADPVEQNGSTEAVWRGRRIARGQKGRLRILDPSGVAQDASGTRKAPGHRYRVAGRRFRHAMILEGVREERTARREPREAARELRRPAIEIIGAELVDGDEDDELRPVGRGAGVLRGQHARRGDEGEQQGETAHRSRWLEGRDDDECRNLTGGDRRYAASGTARSAMRFFEKQISLHAKRRAQPRQSRRIFSG